MCLRGLSKIKVKIVAEFKNGKWICKDVGKTIEKGNKIRNFAISHLVKPHLIDWFTNHREVAQSPYLFPSNKTRNKPMQTNVFQKIFKNITTRARIVDENAHPHVVRHTVGFVMSELGNSIKTVSEFLDHLSEKTTDKYG